MELKEIVESYPTHEDFTKAVEEQLLLLAKEQPDFKYNTSYGQFVRCRYNSPAFTTEYGHDKIKLAGPECKGCIFGQALQNLGWTDEYELKSGSTIDALLEYWVKSDRLLVWRSIQSEQDRGKTWSEAVSLLSANTPATGE